MQRSHRDAQLFRQINRFLIGLPLQQHDEGDEARGSVGHDDNSKKEVARSIEGIEQNVKVNNFDIVALLTDTPPGRRLTSALLLQALAHIFACPYIVTAGRADEVSG